MRPLHAVAAHPRETPHVPLCNTLPDHIARKQVSPFARRVAQRGCVEKFDGLVRNRNRVLEGNQRPPAVI